MQDLSPKSARRSIVVAGIKSVTDLQSGIKKRYADVPFIVSSLLIACRKRVLDAIILPTFYPYNFHGAALPLLYININ